MKQKSINAFFSGAKAASKEPVAASAKEPEAKTVRKVEVAKTKEPEAKTVREFEVTKPKETVSDQENDSEQLGQAKPARKRLRRTVIEEDDDTAAAAPAARTAQQAPVPQPPAAAQQPTQSVPAAALTSADVPMAEAAQQAPAVNAAPPEAATASAPAPGVAEAAPAEASTSKPSSSSNPSGSTPPIASIFQKPAARKAAAASTAAAAGASPAKSPRTKPPASPGSKAGTGASKGEGKSAGATGKKLAKASMTAAKKEEAGAEGAAAAAAGVEELEDASDPISDSDEDAGGEVNDVAADGGNGKKKKKAKGAKPDKSKMDGVGLGAVAAALKYKEADVDSLITWKAGAPVPYTLLANTFEAIAGTTKRLEIVALLVSAFRAILATHPPDLLPAVYLCVNRVAPAHTGIELGIGEATLIKALCEATGKNEASIKKAYEASGDLGVVAVGARSTQKTMFAPPPLTIAGVLKAFKDIASATGSKSGDVKRGMIVKMLVAAKGNETGYVVRSLQAKLRIGLAEQSVLVALAHAVHLHREGARDRDGHLAEKLEAAAQAVKQAYSECPSYDVLIPALTEGGTADLDKRCHFMPGVPVKPMLAKATNAVAEVLDKFSDTEFTVEYKYDGERAQVHVLEGGKSVHIFSRNAENNTQKYPDIVARIPGLLRPHVRSIVFDSEAVAWDPEKGRILPFQVLSTRARKDVAVGDIKVQVVLFVFDCLYLNGESLLHRPLTERREALYGALAEREGQLQYATAKTSRDVEQLETFLTESVEAGTEGLIVKTLGDTYEPSKRSSHWLKLKKDYMEGVGDTFDVVPLGAFHGKGKRTGVYGAYLLGVYDPDSESYQTISKLGTGFSEEVLQQLADAMRPHIIPQPRPYYKWSEGLAPDVWFDAVAVWEVKAADLSISPVYQAARGLVDPAKGISIRFPRLLRVREDKGPEDATSAAQVADMFRSQAVIKQQQAAKAGKEMEEGDYD